MKHSHVAIDQSGAATTELVAAPGAGKRIRVHGYVLAIPSGATATFKSAATGLSGQLTPGVYTVPTSGPVMACAANEALNLVSIGAAVEGHLTYTIERV